MTTRLSVTAALLAALCAAGQSRAQDAFDRALDSQQRIHREARDSQQRIDRLDDQTRRMLEQFRNALWQTQQLTVYASQLQQLVEEQERELASLAEQLREVEVTEREILPLMLKMVETLEQFVEADLPFLQAERRERIAAVRKLMTDPDASIADRFRRLLEAYRIEGDYGRTLGAERTEIEFDGQRRAVDLLHLGRLELYFLTLDGQTAGRWDPVRERWTVIDRRHVADVRKGLRIARETMAAELLVLPVRTESGR